MHKYRTFPVRNCDLCEFDENTMVLAGFWEPDGDRPEGEERYYWTRQAVHMAVMLYGRMLERRFTEKPTGA